MVMDDPQPLPTDDAKAEMPTDYDALCDTKQVEVCVAKATKTPRVPKIPRRKWKRKFIEALKINGIVSEAAKIAGISRDRAYEVRILDPKFAAKWAEAIETSVDDLEKEAFRRAKEGSDALMMFALKGNRPAKYGDKTKHEHSGAGGGPLQTLNLNVEAIGSSMQDVELVRQLLGGGMLAITSKPSDK